MDPYRGDQCPARGPGLSHTTSQETGFNCKHCGQTVSLTPPVGLPEGASEASMPKKKPLHQYRKAPYTARCVECGDYEDDHVNAEKDAQEGCQVNHLTLDPWHTCPGCQTPIEPSLATGVPQGKPEGKGRFPWTQRQKDHLEVLYKAWRGGYYES